MTIKKARLILGDDANKFTDKEILKIILFFETLAEGTIQSLKVDS